MNTLFTREETTMKKIMFISVLLFTGIFLFCLAYDADARGAEAEAVVAVAEAVVVAAVEEVSAAAVAAAGFPAADQRIGQAVGKLRRRPEHGQWAALFIRLTAEQPGCAARGLRLGARTQILPGCREGARQAPLTGQHDRLNAPQSAPPGRMSAPRKNHPPGRTGYEQGRASNRPHREPG